LGLFLVAALAVLAGCSGKQAKCDKAMTKMVDLSVKMMEQLQGMMPAEARKSGADLRADIEKQMSEKRAEGLKACVDKIPDKALDCLLEANDMAGLMKCGPELQALKGK
jgi:outer membrane murein-binding lipoprotein Lpp